VDPVLSDNQDSETSERDGGATDDKGERDDSERRSVNCTEDGSPPPLDDNDIQDSEDIPYDADFAPASATIITLDDSGNEEHVSFVASK